MGKLEGKVAIVSGGGQGIGRSVAIAYAKEGACVSVVDFVPESAAKVTEEIKSFGGRALSVICDIKSRERVNAAVAATVKEFGTVDILVQLAQQCKPTIPFEQITDEDMWLALQSGLYGTLYFMQAVFPYMKEHGGKIINVSSSAALEGLPGQAHYAAQKEGIGGISKVAAHEWGKYKINVNRVMPTALTPATRHFYDNNPQIYADNLKKIPLGRIGDPDADQAPIFVFLASSDSDYITGMVIPADGGKIVLR